MQVQAASLAGSGEQIPPGPAGWPVLANGPAFRSDQLRFLTALQRRYGDAATIRLPRGHRLFFLAAPEAIAHVLVHNAANFTSREINQPAMPFLGDGLLNIDGSLHHQQRALVQPAFGRRRVEAYADIMARYTEELLRGWQPGAIVDMRREMQRLTLRIVAQALLHAELDGPALTRFGEAFDDVITFRERRAVLPPLRVDLPWLPYGRMRAGRRYLDGFVQGLVEQVRASGRDQGDVLSMLLQGRDGTTAMSDVQIRDHIMTLLAAGHETTSHLLTYTLLLLSGRPEVRVRLQAELGRELGGRAPAPADLERLPLLDRVVKEALRLYPPAWVIGRRAIGAYRLAGFTFPAGSYCLMSQWVTHRQPELWPHADSFEPDRWLPPEQGGQTVEPFSYFPFGGGPRMCIGMPFANLEGRVLLATILQRFSPTSLPGERLRMDPLVTLRPRSGTRMRLLPVA